MVIIDLPIVDFGLTKVGERTQTSMLLTNISPAEASWALKDTQDQKDTQVYTVNQYWICVLT